MPSVEDAAEIAEKGQTTPGQLGESPDSFTYFVAGLVLINNSRSISIANPPRVVAVSQEVKMVTWPPSLLRSCLSPPLLIFCAPCFSQAATSQLSRRGEIRRKKLLKNAGSG